MGQIADDMVNGACCQLCGQYFVNDNSIDKAEYEIMSGVLIYEHGYPATCWECWEELNDEEKENMIKSDVKTF